MDFFHAVMNNDLFGLQEALMENPELDVNGPRIGTMTALHVAAEKGYLACVTILLSSGANVNETDQFGYTPLMNAVCSPWELVVTKLIQANCDCNLVDHQGNTAMHLACKTAYPGQTIVQQLIKAGARFDVVNNRGETPLSIAVEMGATTAVQDLLFTGPYLDPNTAFWQSPCHTPLRKAMDLGYFQLARCLILAGYNGYAEVKIYMDTHKDDNVSNADTTLPLSKTEVAYKTWILDHGSSPLSLQGLCRNQIRQLLGSDLKHADRLGLPCKITDFVLFKDIYEPGECSTMHEINSLGGEFLV